VGQFRPDAPDLGQDRPHLRRAGDGGRIRDPGAPSGVKAYPYKAARSLLAGSWFAASAAQ
jgi:hypothetical protein